MTEDDLIDYTPEHGARPWSWLGRSGWVRSSTLPALWDGPDGTKEPS